MHLKELAASVYCKRSSVTNRFKCISGSKSIEWLGQEALKRYSKLRPSSNYSAVCSEIRVLEIRKSCGGAILDPDDVIKDVLDDNDFVAIGKLNLNN